MPLPTPNDNENQKDFVERCMSIMHDEMPDTDQRVAVCMKQWRDSKASASAQKYHRFTAFMERITCEAKFEADGKTAKKKLIGYAATFNVLSEDRGGYAFTIKPGAFVASIARDDIVALFNHNVAYPLGRTSNGSLKLAEDEKGLKIELELPDTACGEDMYKLVERGDIYQMSFGGDIVGRTIHTDPDLELVTITEFKLWDVSLVVFPGFEEGRTEVRVAASSVKTEQPTEAPPSFERLKKARTRMLELAAKR